MKKWLIKNSKYSWNYLMALVFITLTAFTFIAMKNTPQELWSRGSTVSLKVG